MFTEKLQEIAKKLALANPAFADTGFVKTNSSEFRGITSEYLNYFYVRLDTEEGDKTIKTEPFEDSGCSQYFAEFDIKIVISTKCYVDKLLGVFLFQLSKQGIEFTAFSADSEAIYKDETGEPLKTEVYLYSIYARCKEVIHVRKLVDCADTPCINIMDCQC